MTEKKRSLNALVHKQIFCSKGTYSIKKNTIDIATEIPQITLSDSKNDYNLKLKKSFDISSKNIPCMFLIYSHGHPTDRRKLAFENLDWDRKSLPLDSVFKHTNFPQDKILVITLHDEDFEDCHIEIYRFFVQYHVIFNSESKEYECDMELLQKFVAGKLIDVVDLEEPRTIGGGVIDPS